MKKGIQVLAILLTVLCILLSLAYILLLTAKALVPSLPFDVEPNLFLQDWWFMAIPVLALFSSIFLQIASVKQKKKHN